MSNPNPARFQTNICNSLQENPFHQYGRIAQAMTKSRPQQMLATFGKKRYPGIWQTLDDFRGSFQATYGFPAWCFCSQMTCANAFLAHTGLSIPNGGIATSRELMGPVIETNFLYSWRATQGIYRLDPEVYESLMDMEVTGNIPSDIFLRMPEYCLYVETPGFTYTKISGETQSVFGFFAKLDPDAKTGQPWLAFLLDCASGIDSISLRLESNRSLLECIDATINAASDRGGRDLTSNDGTRKNLGALLTPLVNIVLYICTQANDITGNHGKPSLPVAQKTKFGPVFLPPAAPKLWDVGLRVGADLKAARLRSNSPQESGSTGINVRPHIRRAHWHGFWTGPHDGERRFDLRWLPPIAVNVGDGAEISAVVRNVG